ncbi:MAG: hypothetical protein ACK50G_00695 [bacterium]
MTPPSRDSNDKGAGTSPASAWKRFRQMACDQRWYSDGVDDVRARTRSCLQGIRQAAVESGAQAALDGIDLIDHILSREAELEGAIDAAEHIIRALSFHRYLMQQQADGVLEHFRDRRIELRALAESGATVPTGSRDQRSGSG